MGYDSQMLEDMIFELVLILALIQKNFNTLCEKIMGHGLIVISQNQPQRKRQTLFKKVSRDFSNLV
jgi:hypothetical protein